MVQLGAQLLISQRLDGKKKVQEHLVSPKCLRAAGNSFAGRMFVTSDLDDHKKYSAHTVNGYIATVVVGARTVRVFRWYMVNRVADTECKKILTINTFKYIFVGLVWS